MQHLRDLAQRPMPPAPTDQDNVIAARIRAALAEAELRTASPSQGASKKQVRDSATHVTNTTLLAAYPHVV